MADTSPGMGKTSPGKDMRLAKCHAIGMKERSYLANSWAKFYQIHHIALGMDLCPHFLGHISADFKSIL